MRTLTIALLLILSGGLYAQSGVTTYLSDPHSRPREHSVDISNMKVDVSFDCPKGIVKGKVTHTFIPLRAQVDTLFFDGPGIQIKSATLDGQPVEFKSNPEGVTVYFNKPVQWEKTYNLTFDYEATPKKGIYFIGWKLPAVTDPKHQTRRQIWTQGQGIDNRHWIPMYDNMNDKFTTETVVTFDKDYNVLSNGVMKSVKTNTNNTKTWHYQMSKPHAGYLLMLAIDKYAIKKSTTKTGVPVSFWYYPEWPEKVEPTSLYTEKMIEFLEQETGIPYPWESYSQVMVQDFMYGAMENTTATIFGDFFNVDSRGFLDRNYIGVNAHELTHQWFGDLITARSGNETWLQESYATYYSKMFYETIEGSDKVKWIQRGEVNTALKASESDKTPVRHSSAGTQRVYQKGSSVIQMLRYVLGPDAFKKVIRHYLRNHMYANVETNDLLQAVQDVTGQDLFWFFDEWLYRGGEPHYKVSYHQDPDEVNITVEQVHALNELVHLFKMPVHFAVYYRDGSVSRQQFWIERQTETVRIANPGNKTVSFVLFDENSEITKKLTFEKSTEEWLAQLAGAANMIDRYDAVIALKTTPIATKRDALVKAFNKETFYAIKAEIISQLAADEASSALVREQFSEVNTEITKAAMQAIKTIGTDWKQDFIRLLDHPSYDIAEKAMSRLCTEFPSEAADFLGRVEKSYIQPKIYGHNHNIYITWLELGILNGQSPEQKTNELVTLSSDLYEFRTRVSAMESLKRLGICNETCVQNMVSASLSSNGRLAGPAKGVLKYFAEETGQRRLIEQVIRRGTYTEKELAVFREGGFFTN